MNLTVINLANPPLYFTRGLPAGRSLVKLPGAELYSAEDEFGFYCIQEFVGSNFVVRHSQVETKHSLQVIEKSHHNGLHALMMLRNDVTAFVHPSGVLHLNEGCFLCLHGQEPETRIVYRSDETFVGFEAVLNPELMADSISTISELEGLIKRETPLIPDVWFNPPILYPSESNGRIERLFDQHEDEENFEHRYREEVKALVYELLSVDNTSIANLLPLSEEEVKKVIKVQNIILGDLSGKDSTQRLSRKVALSESTLKAIFKRYEGNSIHQYRIQRRLDAAVDMIRQGKYLQQVAAETGWTVGRLIQAYKQRYNKTPSMDQPRRNKS